MNIPDCDPYDFGVWHFILRLPVMILFTLFLLFTILGSIVVTNGEIFQRI